MSPTTERARELFVAALRSLPAGWDAYLDGACGADAELRRGVRELLDAHLAAGSFLERPALCLPATADLDAQGADTVVAPGPAEPPGTVVGPYTLLEVIAEGGMGTVYLAEQTRPVRRQVAVKVVKPGMDSRQMLARFEAERQALALMDHPNIARVLDAGATDAGRPYFVMELVRGVAITDYCDQARLGIPERLALFVSVCRAVQQAHLKGVIHRDLKPANVLVAVIDGAAVPKVIDFGVAKAAGPSLTDATFVTGVGMVVGTPEYMSPEQAELGNRDIDTRSDVYSLGVVLYELLTGTTPLTRGRVRGSSLLEVLRLVREEEPPRPSTRIGDSRGTLTDLTANRRTEPAKLTRLVRGELDWIVMKALEKDRDRRYETVDALARNVQLYLAGEPVEVVPPTVGYRLRKFAGRNRRALTTLGLLGLMLLATLAATAGAVGWAVRDRAARRAEADQEQAFRLAETDRELDRALQEAAEFRDRGEWPRAWAAVQRSEWLAAGGGSEANRRRVRTMATDLRMVSRLEEIRSGDPQMKLYVLDRSVLAPVYAEAFREYGIDVPALDAPTGSARIRASAIRMHLVAALDDWMWAKISKNNEPRFTPPGPERLASEALNRVEYEHLRAVADLAMPDEVCRSIRDPKVQEDRQALEALAGRPEVADLSPSTAILLSHILATKGLTAKATAVLRAVQQRRPDDYLVNFELGMLVVSRRDPLQWEEAIGYLRVAAALRPRNVTVYLRLGDKLRGAERLDQAAAAYRKAFEMQPSNDFAYSYLATTLEKQGKWDDALAVYVQYAAWNQEKSGAHTSLGRAYVRRRQWANAIAACREASRLAPKNGNKLGELAWLLATCPDPELRDAAQAVEWATAAVQVSEKNSSVWRALGVARYRTGDWAGAVAALERANQLSKGSNIQTWLFLAMAHWQQGDQQARQDYDRAVQSLEGKTRVEGDPVTKEEIDRFRAEAAKLLGVKDSPRSAAPEPPPKKL